MWRASREAKLIMLLTHSLPHLLLPGPRPWARRAARPLGAYIHPATRRPQKTRGRQVTRRPQRHEDGRTTPAARRSGKSKCVKEECEKKTFKSICIRSIRNISGLYWVKCVHGKVHVIAFLCTHISPQHYIFVKSTGATPAKNTANAASALRNALTACNTLEGTKRFSGAVWISMRNGQRTS